MARTDRVDSFHKELPLVERDDRHASVGSGGVGMLTMCWAVKGGSGATVVSCALALMMARKHEASWLVDLAGDVPATLGIAEPAGPGIHDWIVAPAAPPAAIEALAIAGAQGLRVVPRGAAPADLQHARWNPLSQYLAEHDQPWIVDAGTGPVPEALAAAAQHRLLVTRPCFLALRRATALAFEPTGVVVVVEPGRALRSDDIAATMRAPIVAEIEIDPAVARSVDAGLLAARLPRTLSSALRHVLP